MTNLGLKILNVVPCYCHHNDVGGTEYHRRQHLPHHVAHHVLVETFLLTVLLYGMVGHYIPKGFRKFTVTFHRISPSESGNFDASALLNTGYFHFT
ncbi:hypothetical protein TNCV_2361861 [Trichonephila clavipes]|nr:hypothetical protein TNCV_2361861 [Trichonephila clavipes]